MKDILWLGNSININRNLINLIKKLIRILNNNLDRVVLIVKMINLVLNKF